MLKVPTADKYGRIERVTIAVYVVSEQECVQSDLHFRDRAHPERGEAAGSREQAGGHLPREAHPPVGARARARQGAPQGDRLHQQMDGCCCCRSAAATTDHSGAKLPAEKRPVKVRDPPPAQPLRPPARRPRRHTERNLRQRHHEEGRRRQQQPIGPPFTTAFTPSIKQKRFAESKKNHSSLNADS